MKPKLIVILLLITLTPVALLAWMGARVARGEQERLRRRFSELLTAKLRDVDDAIMRLLQERERGFLRIAESRPWTARALRTLARSDPLLDQVFLLGPDRKRIFPPRPGPLTEGEKAFLLRAGQIWKDKGIFYIRPETAPRTAPVKNQKRLYAPRQQSIANIAPMPTDHGWYVWFWGPGVNIVFWYREPSNRVIGFELNRARLLADIIAALPDTGPTLRSARSRIALKDSKDAVIYQWGALDPPKGQRPAATLSLGYPLNSWKLVYYAPPNAFGQSLGRGMMFNLVSGLVVVVVALIGLGVYFYRESSREMRLAQQRVSFVNQVSHELKTPLTSIRMYAELLEDRLSAANEPDEKAAGHLGVIVSESRRLSRLIGNVLTFARKERQKLAIRMKPGVVDDTVREALEHFRPALEARGVEVSLDLDAAEPARFDADALEQILGNLISNVEKYAASGKWMQIATRRSGDSVTVRVSDRGPGAPRGARRKIFAPFYRVGGKLSDGVAGAGIGLAIARDLARLHGGDLTLKPGGPGATFELIIHAPHEENHESPDS